MPDRSALLREIDREGARDRLVGDGWARVESGCATSGGPAAPGLRSEAERAAAARTRIERSDAWAATPRGRAATALGELAALLAETHALRTEAQARADRAFAAEAAALAEAARGLEIRLKAARQAALDLWLAAEAALTGR